MIWIAVIIIVCLVAGFIIGTQIQDRVNAKANQLRIDEKLRGECIGYNNWVSTLNKNGFPKNDNGTSMDCWQLYDYYFQASNKRHIFIHHAEKLEPKR